MNLTRDRLATLVRELLLCGHLIDRATMPHVLARWDRQTMATIAIDEWMGASPIYTRRMQRLLGFVGDDVATIFKGMQLDIGAPRSSWTSATPWKTPTTVSSTSTTVGRSWMSSRWASSM